MSVDVASHVGEGDVATGAFAHDARLHHEDEDDGSAAGDSDIVCVPEGAAGDDVHGPILAALRQLRHDYETYVTPGLVIFPCIETAWV